MQRVLILVGLIALVTAPCFAQAPSAAPVNLAAILGLPGDAGAPPQSHILFLAGGGTGHPLDVTCTATCGSDPSVSCTATSGTCTAVNRSCSAERGHVTCNGVTTYCSATCACTEGQIQDVATGPICSCADGMRTPKNRNQCIGGEWVYQYSFCGGPFCQG
jgi:hypothetical protein